MVTHSTSQQNTLSSKHRNELLKTIEGRLQRIQVSTPVNGSAIMASGPATQRVGLGQANPRFVAQYQEKLINLSSRPSFPKMNYIVQLYVTNKVLSDIETIIEARTPATGYTDFSHLNEAIEAELFSNPDYQRHLKAYSELAILAFHPWHFSQSDYRVPEQYKDYGGVVRPHNVPAHLITGREDEVDEDSSVWPMNDGSGNFRIPLSEALLADDIEMSPTPEANLRLNAMIDFIQTHKQDLFLPASDDHIALATAIHEGRLPELAPTSPLQMSDQNTPQDVDEKIQHISDAVGHIKDVALKQGQPARPASGAGILVRDQMEVPIPALGFTHTLMQLASRAMNPSRAPHDVAKECRLGMIENSLVESGAVMHGLAQDDPDLVFTTATVRHGRAILAAEDAPDLKPDVIMKQ